MNMKGEGQEERNIEMGLEISRENHDLHMKQATSVISPLFSSLGLKKKEKKCLMNICVLRAKGFVSVGLKPSY